MSDDEKFDYFVYFHEKFEGALKISNVAYGSKIDLENLTSYPQLAPILKIFSYLAEFERMLATISRSEDLRARYGDFMGLTERMVQRVRDKDQHYERMAFQDLDDHRLSSLMNNFNDFNLKRTPFHDESLNSETGPMQPWFDYIDETNSYFSKIFGPISKQMRKYQ